MLVCVCVVMGIKYKVVPLSILCDQRDTGKREQGGSGNNCFRLTKDKDGSSWGGEHVT